MCKIRYRDVNGVVHIYYIHRSSQLLNNNQYCFFNTLLGIQMFISFNFEIAFREIHKKANRTNELSILIKYNKFLKMHQH